MSCSHVTTTFGAAVVRTTYDEVDGITAVGHTTELVVASVNAAHTPVTE